MKIVLKIAVAMALVLLTNAALREYYLQNAVSRSAIRVLDEAADAYPDPISTLFLGDSHIGRSVDARVFGSQAYTLWSPGQCYVRSYYRLEALLNESDHPLDRLIVGVSQHSFVGTHLQSIAKPPWPKYIRYSEVGEAFDKPPNYAWRRARASFMPYAGHFEDYFMMRKEEVTLEDVLALQGALPHPETLSPKVWTTHMATVRLNAQFPLGPEPIAEGYTTYLRRIVELGDARDAEVVLITTPVTQVYWEEGDAFVSYDALYAAIAEFSNVTYLDYHDMFFDRPDLFRDADHLNEVGSALFSERLKADLTAQRGAQE